MKEKVLIAMSGGVDSTLTAYTMLKAGYDVLGVTIRFFPEQDQAVADGEKAAKELGVNWYCADYSHFFKEDVIDYFINTYMQGKTPNPCSTCNRHAKMNYLFREMQAHCASKIATGHYARKVMYEDRWHVAKGLDPKKDQSYYLSLLEQRQLDVLEFPLGGLEKTAVKARAAELGLSVAEKKESQDICFLMNGDYRDFLEKHVDMSRVKQGWFVKDGQRIKEHKGIIYYTVGQRRGLDMGGFPEPIFVKDINPETGDITISEKSGVTGKSVKLENCEFPDTHDRLFRAQVKVRYRMNPIGCSVEIQPGRRATVLFDTPEFAPAPGQVATVYVDDVVIGGGYIAEVF